MDRGRTFGIEHGATVPVDGLVALGLVLRTARRKCIESDADAAAGRAVHAHTVLRRSKDDGCAQQARLRRKSETSPATIAADGTGSDLSKTEFVETCAGASHLSVPVAPGCHHAANQVWSTDITYIRLRAGFIYLVAVMDWFSRYVLSWEISTSLDAGFCCSALDRALRHGRPEIFNTDQGAQFTSDAFTGRLEAQNILISMDGRGRALDNVFVERLWRTVKYEDVYLKDYRDPPDALCNLRSYFSFYNGQRSHQALDYRTPEAVYFGIPKKARRPLRGDFS